MIKDPIIDLSWEEKFEIICSIMPAFNISLKMREPGNWYVCPHGRYIVGDGLQRGEYGNGTTPKEAIENDFNMIINLPSDRYVCVDAGGKQKYYRLKKHFWKEYSVDEVYPNKTKVI